MTYKLLLADDSITIQRVIELTFSGEDVDVVSVGDGEQAIQCLQAERPDIVLADIAMPKRNGYDVAAYVKSQPDFAHVPVLLLAGAFEPVDEARAEAVRSDGVLVKPFEPQQVVARVRELLIRRSSIARRLASSAAPASVIPPADPPVAPQEPVAPAPVAASQPDDVVSTYPMESTELPPPAPVQAPPSTVVAPEAQPLASPPAASERPADIVPPPKPAIGPGESLDEFFGRLGSAVASLGAARSPEPPSPPPPSLSDDPWTYGDVPTVSGLLDQSAPEWPSASQGASALAPDRITARDAFAMDSLEDSRLQTSRAARHEAGRNVIADAFHALLAAEQGRPRPADPVPIAIAPPPAPVLVVTDELVDRVTQRVLERLVPHAARDMVTSIVSDIAERLVREEIARARTRADSRFQAGMPNV